MNNSGRIIHYLATKPALYTLHELSKLTAIPYATFYRTVNKLHSVLNLTKKGSSTLLTLRWNELSRAHLVLFSAEQKNTLENSPLLQQIENRSKDIVLIFGSYAKNTHTDKSDLDLMVINENGDTTIEFRDLELLYKKEINPLFFSKEEFIAMLQDKEENVAKQARKHHILLSGFEDFWKLEVVAPATATCGS